MKKFLLILFLIFTFQTSSQADDIRDFEIEGMSIGDSLLDFFSKEEIKNNIMWHYNDNKKNNEFVVVEFFSVPYFETYDGAQFIIKTEDKKYKIYAITGAISFKKNINNCYPKMEKIADEISQVLKSAEKSNSKFNSPQDKTGKSTVTGIYFEFEDGGNASVQCYDYSKAMHPRIDNLRVALRTKEYRRWYYDSIK